MKQPITQASVNACVASYCRPEVLAFALTMEFKLRKNAHKDGWHRRVYHGNRNKLREWGSKSHGIRYTDGNDADSVSARLQAAGARAGNKWLHQPDRRLLSS